MVSLSGQPISSFLVAAKTDTRYYLQEYAKRTKSVALMYLENTLRNAPENVEPELLAFVLLVIVLDFEPRLA